MIIGTKLCECLTGGEFTIIDNWTKQIIETLHWKEAFDKYGDCIVRGAFTKGFCKSGDEDRFFSVDVWIDIPGMKLGYANGERYTLPSNNPDEASFIGRKTGQLITVTRNGKDDYEVWFRDESEADKDTAGCSVRGTMLQIMDELKGEI